MKQQHFEDNVNKILKVSIEGEKHGLTLAAANKKPLGRFLLFLYNNKFLKIFAVLFLAIYCCLHICKIKFPNKTNSILAFGHSYNNDRVIKIVENYLPSNTVSHIGCGFSIAVLFSSILVALGSFRQLINVSNRYHFGEVYRIFLLIISYNFFAKNIKKLMPKAVFVSNDHSPFQLSFITAAKNMDTTGTPPR